MNDDSIYTSIPPWLRHFLVHVVKRCAMILVKWIDGMIETCKKQSTQDGRDGR